MTNDPEELKRQIEELKAKLRVVEASTTSDTLNAQESQGAINRPTGSVDQTFGNADVQSDNYGQNIAINQGTVQQFFGTSTPGEDKTILLSAYLTSLTSECQQLRLHRLVEQRQTGNEQQTVPQLKLQSVYTSLATNVHLVIKERQRSTRWIRRLNSRLRLDQRTPDKVSPDQVRYILFRTPDGKSSVDSIDGYILDDPDAVPIMQPTQKGVKFAIFSPEELWTLMLYRPMLATETIRQNYRLVLLGEPGSGKSTVLRYLGLLLALRIQNQHVALPAGWDRDKRTNRNLPFPPGWDEETLYMPVPILCPLGTVAEILTHTTNADQALWQAIEQTLDDTQGSRTGLRDHLKDAIRGGGVLLLFDGLDELPTSGNNPRQQVAQAVRRFAVQTAPNTPIVVTSRVKPYQESHTWQMPADEGWQVDTIQPLAFGQVQQFARQWYDELAGALDEPAAERAENLLKALRSTSNKRIQKLIESPLLLTMLAILHYNRNELPEDRAEVYEQCVDLLLDRWEPRRTHGVQHVGLLARLAIPNLKIEQLREELHKLALQAHAQPPGDDGRGLLDRYAVTGRLVEFFERLRVEDPLMKVNLFIDGLVKETGLLQVPNDNHYAFPHLTFQEYLAACGLASNPDMVNVAYKYWAGSDASRWREVLLLFMGRLRQHGGSLAVERDAVAWLERLTAAKVGRQSKSPRQRAQDAMLAALSYQELGGQIALAGTQIDIEAKVEQPLRTAIVDLLNTPNSGVVLDDRLTAARILADLGDPRFPVTLDEWHDVVRAGATGRSSLPPYFCPVEAGTYTIGGWEEDEPSADIALPGFWIARYPVTVAQYRAFIDAGGYRERAYWTAEGWMWKQQRYRIQPWGWNDVQYHGSNQAVIGVTWYECVAFCMWLTAQLVNELPEGYEICLPTEAEWEVAAAYAPKPLSLLPPREEKGGRRTYPWGEDEPTAEHAIYDASKLIVSSSVGTCPAGAAACGALDMVGNVREWCRSSHNTYPQGAHELHKDFTIGDWVVPVRGGTYRSDSTNVRCGARDWDRPDRDFNVNLGFRVFLAPSAVS